MLDKLDLLEVIKFDILKFKKINIEEKNILFIKESK